MQITDKIADMLTRIRNANAAKHDTVDVPSSNMKKAIAQILLDEGYIRVSLESPLNTVWAKSLLSQVCVEYPNRDCAFTPAARKCLKL